MSRGFVSTGGHDENHVEQEEDKTTREQETRVDEMTRASSSSTSRLFLFNESMFLQGDLPRLYSDVSWKVSLKKHLSHSPYSDVSWKVSLKEQRLRQQQNVNIGTTSETAATRERRNNV